MKAYITVSGTFSDKISVTITTSTTPKEQFCSQAILIHVLVNMKIIFLMTRTVSFTTLWKIYLYLNSGIIYDNVVNAHGKNLLQICENFDLRILNGRIRGDSFRNITYHGRLGVSTVDYFTSDQSLFQYVDHLIVKSPTYFFGSQPNTYLAENTRIQSYSRA